MAVDYLVECNVLPRGRGWDTDTRHMSLDPPVDDALKEVALRLGQHFEGRKMSLSFRDGDEGPRPFQRGMLTDGLRLRSDGTQVDVMEGARLVLRLSPGGQARIRPSFDHTRLEGFLRDVISG